MAAFVVDRLNALKGRGVKSGEWCFDELMLCDCVQAQGTVRYDVKVIESRDDDEDTITIRNPVCTEAIVFDDFGAEIALPQEEKAQLKTAVLEAFMWNMDAVIEFERQLRFVIPVR
jgi:hypothetical protein